MMGQAVILLFLSDFKKGDNLITYKYDERQYQSTQTNDAAVACLKDLARKETIVKVLCICSKLVYTNTIEELDNKTQYERFTEYIGNLLPDAELVPIRYDFEFNDNGEICDIPEDKDRARGIYSQLAEQLKDHRGCSVYLDYTGGLRDTSFLMVSLIRYMEYADIKLKRIVYAEWIMGTQNGCIHNLNHIYKVFRLIEGVSIFVQYGRSDALSEAFKDLPKETSSLAKRLIKNMKAFSDALVLSDISNINQLYSNIAVSLNELENAPNNELDLYTKMLKTLCPLIRDKMYISEENISIVSVARWCVDNDLIQQALTIYVEKIPEYLIDERRYIFPEYIEFKAAKNGEKKGDIFYREAFDGVLEGERAYRIKRLFSNISCSSKNFDVKECAKKLESLKEENPEYEKEINNLIAVINEKKKFDIGEESKKKFKEVFVKAVISQDDSNGIKYRQLLIGNEKKYQEYNRFRSTYYRKKTTLWKIEKQKQLFDILSNYLNIKICRNSIIHVSETKYDNGENKAKDYLISKGLTVGEDLNSVKQMLYNAIHAVEVI